MVLPYKLAASLEKFFSEQGKQLFVYALSVTGSPEQAEDAVQEVFYDLFRLRRRPRHLKAYVYRSVRNAAFDQLRRDPPVQIEVSESIYDPDVGPGDKAAGNEFKRRVVEAMKTLSDNERETVVSHLYSDLSFRDIAEVRQLSTNTVASWYRRGIEKLRTCLEKER